MLMSVPVTHVSMGEIVQTMEVMGILVNALKDVLVQTVMKV